jgi:hypothetical protein
MQILYTVNLSVVDKIGTFIRNCLVPYYITFKSIVSFLMVAQNLLKSIYFCESMIIGISSHSYVNSALSRFVLLTLN